MIMADKQSVIIYHDWLDVFESLSAEESQYLITSIIKYSQSDIEPETRSQSFNMAWKFIKKTLQRDKDKYLNRCTKNAENGKKGGRSQKQTVSEETEKSERFFEKPKKADNDSDNDNETDNDSVSVNDNIPCAHAHGRFKNVFLTDDEYRDFKKRYRDVDAVIDELSDAIAAEPKKYMNGDIKAWLHRFIRRKNGNKEPSRIKELH